MFHLYINTVKAIILLIILCIFLSSCVKLPRPLPDNFNLVKVEFADLPEWGEDNYQDALESFIKSCKKISPSPHKLNENALAWQRVCYDAIFLSFEHKSAEYNNSIKEFFEYNFQPFKVQNYNKDIVLFTGYYEPILRGSRKAYGPYKHPIYKAPKLIVKGSPLLSRKSIENGFLKNSNLEIAFVDDNIELFFLHIQGSGRIKLDDGSTIRVGYKDQNGHPYTAIGRYISEYYNVDKTRISAPFIKKWLRNHKKSIASHTMNQNASYVFFQETTENADHPFGSQGVALTPERSLAIDPKFIPYGTPIWVDTTYPATPNYKSQPYRKLLIAQDKGGAIKGPLRADIFFGRGPKAEELAGYMKQTGKFYQLIPIAQE